MVDGYTTIYGAGLESRKERYQSLVNHYYDLVTDFYEFGWGQSFHFAPRRRGESFKASLLRHQRFLAARLSLKPGMQVLDVGCGVGGPMGNLARHSCASNKSTSVSKGFARRIGTIPKAAGVSPGDGMAGR